jgi:hypothetical protein
VLLTAEELHYLAAAQGLDDVPGLGPLPLDPDDPASVRLMVGTAERSLLARGVDATLLAPLADPAWTVAAELVGEELVGVRGWWPLAEGVAELTRISAVDYELVVVERLASGVAEFLFLHGDDESVNPAGAGEVPKDGLFVHAERLTRVGDGAQGVVLEWVDAGDGPVWVIEPGSVTRTGRAAVLRELLDGHLD